MANTSSVKGLMALLGRDERREAFAEIQRAHVFVACHNAGVGTGEMTEDAKTWEQVADEPLPCDVATFRRLMESTIPDLYTKLQARHKKLGAIYAHARKRARATIADSLFQQSAGRNDACPCGSGKKFKKCCMGKGLRGADARRTESTITIRR